MKIKFALEGNFEEGFSVNLQIFAKGFCFFDKNGYLPPYPNMPLLLCQWQKDFCGLLGMEYECPSDERTQFSCSDSAEKLRTAIDQWLNCCDDKRWRDIRDGFVRYLPNKSSNLVFIHTENSLLRYLPWLAWDLFHENNVEVILGMSGELKKTKRAKNRILAILGRYENTNAQADINKLTDQWPSLTSLIHPSKEDFSESLRNKKGWRIFFFAGHGDHKQRGCFPINQKDSICANEYSATFSKAIEQGMEIAIFNSCAGLNIAVQLALLNLPCSIVMREVIPDKAAQRFLETFLKVFVKEAKPLHVSVQEARLSLEEFQEQYPGIMWIPISCQKLTVKSPIWFNFFRKVLKGLTRLTTIVVIAIIAFVSALLLGVQISNNNQAIKKLQDEILSFNVTFFEVQAEVKNIPTAQQKIEELQEQLQTQERTIEELSQQVEKLKIDSNIQSDTQLDKANLILLRIENRVSQYSQYTVDKTGNLIFEPDVFIKVNGVQKTELKKIGSQSSILLNQTVSFSKTAQIELWISERDGSRKLVETFEVNTELAGKGKQSKEIADSKPPHFLEEKGITSELLKYQWHYVIHYKVELP